MWRFGIEFPIQIALCLKRIGPLDFLPYVVSTALTFEVSMQFFIHILYIHAYGITPFRIFGYGEFFLKRNAA